MALEAIRVDYLGKKGTLTELLKNLVNLPPDEKPKMGQLVNQVKRELSLAIEQRTLILKSEELQQKLETERLDVSLPGRRQQAGTLHPVTQVKRWLNDLARVELILRSF